jgi:hypothetical protein
MRFGLLGLVLAVGGLTSGCENNATKGYKPPAAKCASDDGCGKGFICTDGLCAKGERSAKELADRKKAKFAAAKKKRADADKVKPGEGRLWVRICPGYQNTPESMGSIQAINVKTKKRHLMHLALTVPDGGWETEFKFPSVPLGTYEVQATYGIQVKGKADVHKLSCHEKVDKKLCVEEITRLIEVVAPDQEPERVKEKDGTFKRRACDFIAE